MKKYRGYYIDKVTFNNEAEIDAFIREQLIKGYRNRLEVVFVINKLDMEGVEFLNKYEQTMVANGFTWEEIEQLEIDFLEKIA